MGRHSVVSLWDLVETDASQPPPKTLKKELYRQLGLGLMGKRSMEGLLHASACITHLWGRQALSGMLFRKALARYSRIKETALLAACHRDYGLALQRQLRPGDARDHWEQARSLFLQCGDPVGYASLEGFLENADGNGDEGVEGNTAGFHPQKSRDSLQSMHEDVYHLQLEEIHKVHRMLKPREDPGMLMDSILRALIRATNATHAALILEDQKPGQKPEWRVHAMDFREKRLPEDGIPIDWELVAGARAGKSLESLNDSGGGSGQSVICAPLWRESYLGCLYLVNQRSSRLFGPSALKAVQILSTQAALLLDHSRHIQEVQALNSKLGQKVSRQAEVILSKNKMLRRSRSNLKRVRYLKTLLTETIIHDVKNYGAVITSNLRIAEQCSAPSRGAALPRTAKKNLDLSLKACSQINTLASNLIDLTKMEESPGRLNKTRLTREALEALVREARSQISNPPVWKIEQGIPTSFDIHWDAYYLKRVWTTLAELLEETPGRGSGCIALEPLPENLQAHEPAAGQLGLVFCHRVAGAHGGFLGVDPFGSLFLALDKRYSLKPEGLCLK